MNKINFSMDGTWDDMLTDHSSHLNSHVLDTKNQVWVLVSHMGCIPLLTNINMIELVQSSCSRILQPFDLLIFILKWLAAKKYPKGILSWKHVLAKLIFIALMKERGFFEEVKTLVVPRCNVEWLGCGHNKHPCGLLYTTNRSCGAWRLSQHDLGERLS